MLNVEADIIGTADALWQFTKKQLAASVSEIIHIEGVPKLGVDIFGSLFNNNLEMLTKSWAETNSRLIKSLNINVLDDVANIIETGFRSGTSLNVIKAEIQVKFKTSVAKAAFLARDQTAKLHSNYVRNEHLKFGITDYIWSTSNDERVRTSHRVLNTMVCKWTDPIVYRHQHRKRWLSKTSIGGVLKQAGEDYQCRCAIIALIYL